MNRIAVIAGFKSVPDYSRSWFNALLAQKDPRFDFVALVSRESNFEGFDSSRVFPTWTKSIFHPFQIWAKLLQERPALVHLQHEINMFGGAIGVLSLPVLMALLKLSRFKVVTTLHVVVPLSQVRGKFSGLFSFPPLSLLSFLMRLGMLGSYWCAAKLSDALVVHSEGLKRTLIQSYGANGTKVHVIPHLELGDVMNRANLTSSYTNTILCFGYLLRRKGIEQLIEAFAQVSNNHSECKLIIAGGSPQSDYRQELESLISRHQLQNKVHLTGFLNSEDIFSYFRDSLGVVIPAVASFSASGPYATAMAFEKPIVAPNLGYFAETVKPEEDGLLYQPNSIDSLVAVLNRLMADGELREKLIRGIKARRKHFSGDNIARETLQLYSQMLRLTEIEPK